MSSVGLQPLFGDYSRECSTKRETGPVTFDAMVGSTPQFRAALDLAKRLAAGDQDILIEGETGTGKHMLAGAIYAASSSPQAELRVVRVKEASERALTSLLFGHVKGAFLGAFDDEPGLLQLPGRRILLLEDVHRLPFALQKKLATALRARVGRPEGGLRSYPISARIIALSAQSLPDLVRKKSFEPLLYDTLAKGRIVLPPLRERPGDVPLLAQHFLRLLENSPTRRISLDKEATAFLRSLDWPGNVRQLHVALLEAFAQSRDSVLRVVDFGGSETTTSAQDGSAGSNDLTGIAPLLTELGHVRPLAEIEAEVIRLALARYDGRMSEIARRLGIGRSTLYRKLKDLEQRSSQDSEK